MAACDNLYGNRKQWRKLKQFIAEKKPEYLVFMRERPEKVEINEAQE